MASKVANTFIYTNNQGIQSEKTNEQIFKLVAEPWINRGLGGLWETERFFYIEDNNNCCCPCISLPFFYTVIKKIRSQSSDSKSYVVYVWVCVGACIDIRTALI